MGTARLVWKGARFMVAVAAHLEHRGDAVGEMVADEMRSRAPRSATGTAPGGGHAADRITHTVTRIPDGVRISAGAPAMKPDVLAFAENGTSRQRARPWARPAVFGNKAKILRRLARG